VEEEEWIRLRSEREEVGIRWRRGREGGGDKGEKEKRRMG
jgi:hypothetical protein